MSYIPSGYLPVLPLKNTVLYPGISQALRVGREKSIRALQKAFDSNNWILAVAQKDPSIVPSKGDELYTVGVLCKIESSRGNQEQGFALVVRGYQRMKITDIKTDAGYFEAMSEAMPEADALDEATQRALLISLKELSAQVLKLIPGDTAQLSELVQGIDDLNYLVHTAAAHADFEVSDKQKLLETLNLRERTMQLLNLLQNLKDNLQVQSEIRAKLNTKFGNSHREQILREQLKAIKEELGEGEDANLDETYRKKIEEAGMPEEARKLAESQLKRLGETSSSSPETQVIRNHLDLMVSLPWNKHSSQEDVDLEKARAILEADHDGLEKIKKRILQHLAVLKMKKNQQGSILLFVGPPGVGKTSLGQSIAKALGRKYARVSLGGVRDDAEIRGHRRTYVGALPGRIITALKRAGENNPVFILDEVDKMSRGFTGDPASAMLEVLDPEQNKAFLDHYLDVGFDLSKILFIGTANSLEGIPGPLLDRMEIIDLSGYTTPEKFKIAKRHLIPKQWEENGLTAEQLQLSDEAILKVITAYTREAGVRELQRKIGTVARAATESVLQAKELPVRVEVPMLEEFLGPERFIADVADHAAANGVVTGLAWTPVGGDILFIEAASMPGKGELLMTGQLGDVMKESARIAMSLLKSRWPATHPGVDFGKQDVHIHVPQGAIPKDGPSAGVTILTSLASLFSRRRVDPKLAMTGEITLRGAVLPVGGIKEKVLAAHRAGVTTVILSKRNERDLKEVPDEVKAQMRFHFVDDVNDVLRIALGWDNLPVDMEAEPMKPQPPRELPPPSDAH